MNLEATQFSEVLIVKVGRQILKEYCFESGSPGGDEASVTVYCRVIRDDRHMTVSSKS